MPYKEWFKEEIEEIRYQEERDELLAKHADSIVVWLTGLSTAILIAILYNFEKIEHITTETYLRYSLFCLLVSVVFALAFRTSLYFLLEKISMHYLEVVGQYRKMKSLPAEKLQQEWRKEWDKFYNSKEVKDLGWRIIFLRKLCITLAIAAAISFTLIILFLVLGATQHPAQLSMTLQKQPIP